MMRPTDSGEKVMLTLHVPPAASELPQVVFEMLYSPLAVIAPMVRALPLVFVTVMVCAPLVAPSAALNVRLVSLKEIGAFTVPVPVAANATTSGIPPVALSVITIEPSSVVAVGCTCTAMVQNFPGFNVTFRQGAVFAT